jgi:hypothetical protein
VEFFFGCFKAVPSWFLLILLTVLLCWFAGLSYIAFFTARAVEFFPPKIGTDPAIVKEIQNLTVEIKELIDGEQKYRSEPVKPTRRRTE